MPPETQLHHRFRKLERIHLTLPDAIVDREIFDAARRQLEGNAADRVSASNAKSPSLLTGLIYDETGDRLCPTHANKKGRRYRYYISKRLMHKTGSTDGGWRLPAKELDGAVAQAVCEFLTDELRIIEALQLTGIAPDHLRSILRRAAAAANDLDDKQPEARRQLLHRLLHCVTLGIGSMRIEIQRTGLGNLVLGNSVPATASQEGLFDLSVPIALKRRGVEAKLIVRAAQDIVTAPDRNLVALIAQAHRWFDQLVAGEIGSIREIAERDGIDASDVGRTIQLAFLAPDIIEAILTGRQPVDLTARRLRRIGILPQEWEYPRSLLGFAA